MLALLREQQGAPAEADLWLESAQLATQITYDREWLVVGDAILALWRGAPDADLLAEEAEDVLYGNPRGTAFYSGENLAWSQYLRDAFPEQFLPQITTLPRYPQAANLLHWAFAVE